MKVLEVNNLRKKLGKREIIKGVTFSVEEGEIFGFLGPNGAGKTTTIRMLVGLIKPDSGVISICGHDIQKESIKALEQVGAVVENPELYKYLSGRENLMQIARIRKVSVEEVNDTIKLVGLENRIDDKVKRYSLGMKQRLGLAASLLSSPKLLILDEPTNGLDPSGIIDFREIVKQAARKRGMAVFVSSHILAEVQNLCDRVAFINDGVIKAVEDIHDNTMATEKDIICLVSSSDKATLIKEIKSQTFVQNVREIEKGLEIILESNKTPSLVNALVNANLEIEEVFKERKGLEQRYMELVEGGIR
ncbi:ABC transporter ATP-binding protein [Clostridium septicum]|uniref:ABC transporter ATP-binding protein n=1 Tax=Clostridium septicum TaxID=1504 RepID=A0A9N7PKN4_CLOSE|nr:ABC transporter ATP-binding protein [Clostridium septicum]AYE34227.1 ABC transporter ATP-binding protein [Clostridium septicum]MDU1314723.1 ABC transporter ATP-binding protein [Clostridium septicum]QAS59632.1 ABC transporter ATP-binding protein [Clostridium septicum]UEC21139.1 ABC transporter ATP-binding protein [Clostridium septicum]USS00813.1 ABC transporter ATP-binding protein [Clostridium septicum]